MYRSLKFARSKSSPDLRVTPDLRDTASSPLTLVPIGGGCYAVDGPQVCWVASGDAANAVITGPDSLGYLSIKYTKIISPGAGVFVVGRFSDQQPWIDGDQNTYINFLRPHPGVMPLCREILAFCNNDSGAASDRLVYLVNEAQAHEIIKKAEAEQVKAP